MTAQAGIRASVPVQTVDQPATDSFDFEKAYEALEEAFVRLHAFYPRENSPFSPKQYAAAVKFIHKCSHITAAFYDLEKDEVVL